MHASTAFLRTVRSYAVSLVLCAGCGNSQMVAATDVTPMPDLGPVPDLTPPPDLSPQPPTPLPQVTQNGGAVLTDIQLVTVNFSDSTYVSDVEAWGDYIVTSPWLTAVGAEYGVLGGKHVMKVELPMAAPESVTDGQLATQIKMLIMSGALPAPTNTQYNYMLYFPPTTMIVDPSDEVLCSQFSGYHRFATYNGRDFTYSVIGDCNEGLDAVTVTASHELIEAATDPYAAGYFLAVTDDDPWSVENGLEVGDMCENGTSIYMGGYSLQKIWSNAAAAKQIDPCQPMAPPVYVNVYATPSDVPSVAAGASIEFRLTGWATGTTPAWDLKIANADSADYDTTSQQPVLSSKTIFEHQSVTLTLTAPMDAQSGDLGGVLIQSGIENNAWVVAYSVE